MRRSPALTGIESVKQNAAGADADDQTGELGGSQLQTTVGGNEGQEPTVVSGGGTDLARGTSCVFKVVGVQSVSGKVPDDRPGAERHAVAHRG
jgi:hypothetical protein